MWSGQATSPGTITVTVEAQGLTAGRVTLQAIAPKDDSVPGIAEPALRDDGRLHVTRDASVKPRVFSARSHKLTEITQDYDLPANAAKDYRAAIISFIQQRNIDVDASTAEFRMMVDHLATSLQRTNGHLIADDYNFLVRQFNDARKKR